jgi:hypothetical protein
METPKDALSVDVSSNQSFAKRYFTSAVSRTALASFILALGTAWISASADDWWKSYLQDLSTTFVGIAATVLVINFLLEQQANRLGAPKEQAAMHLARHFITRAPLWLPKVPAPDSMYWHQLEWIRDHLDRLQTLSDSITPGTGDLELLKAVSGFRSQHLKWSESFETLHTLIRMKSPDKDRELAFDSLKERTNDVIGSARALDDILSPRHKDSGVLLDLYDE